MPATAPLLSDADLVRHCLATGAGAFADIVARYQALVCAVTYNATGSLSRSEDLAQEVFVTAWKELRSLREPEKLRPWLCGIARRLTANTRRREGREPAHAADELQDEHHAAGPGPAEQAISREEEAILWRSLEQIPENYREPLILFYREGNSVESVAAALELTEETARQRLSRGRKLLQEQVAQFVEGALRQTTPGRAFTLGVLAGLPLLSSTATAATIGTAVAKTGASATGMGLAGMLAVVLGPIAGCLGAWLGVKTSLDNAKSPRERQIILRQTRLTIGLVLGFMVAMGFAMPFAVRLSHTQMKLAMALTMGLPVFYVIVLLVTICHFRTQVRRVRLQEEALLSPEENAEQNRVEQAHEYISPRKLLGLPLVHIRSDYPRGAKLRPVVAWIAIGDVAFGVLFSCGAISVGAVSCGGLSVGLVALGGAALGGLFACGGIAMSLWAASGGMAIGYLAHGGCALAWHAAAGGVALAHDYALGGMASAAHANDALAREAIDASSFFGKSDALMRQPVLANLVWLPLLLVFWQARVARRRKAQHLPESGTGH